MLELYRHKILKRKKSNEDSRDFDSENVQSNYSYEKRRNVVERNTRRLQQKIQNWNFEENKHFEKVNVKKKHLSLAAKCEKKNAYEAICYQRDHDRIF